MCYSGKCPHEGSSGDCNLSQEEIIEYHKNLEETEPEICHKDCQHLRVTVYWKLYARETRFEPAEYVGKAQCQDCGEWMEPEDISEEAERKDTDV